jgi:hypothetical protein
VSREIAHFQSPVQERPSVNRLHEQVCLLDEPHAAATTAALPGTLGYPVRQERAIVQQYGLTVGLPREQHTELSLQAIGVIS